MARKTGTDGRFAIQRRIRQATTGIRARSSGLQSGQNGNQILKASSSPSSQNDAGKYAQAEPQLVQNFVLG
jgi:hypothetical protein